jgi:hypothetical protein
MNPPVDPSSNQPLNPESIHHLHNLNHWALLVAALVLWLIGAVWYSPILFARPWMKLIPAPASPGKSNAMVVGMISSFICDIVLAFVLWHFVTWAGAHSWATGAFIGFLTWLGFIVAPQLPQGIYENRPFPLFAINSGYWLVGLLISGALLATWR